MIKTIGLLLISVELLTLLKTVSVVWLLTFKVNSVAAIPVNDSDISSNRTFLSSGVPASNLLLKALPPNIDPVSSPTGPI